MSTLVKEEFYDLLNPVKDIEKSFQVDIAQLLYSYITSFLQGKVPPNFNSAALLLQGSSSIYGKKVEYLHNLATQLYQNLVKNKKEDPAKKETVKVKDKHKENKFSDPFFSTEIKLGKNLSCLKKKNTAKNATNKKFQRKGTKKSIPCPVGLLSFDGEEKGDVFYDVKGEAVGFKGDYTLNKCRVTKSGWMTLPTVSSDQVPTFNSLPDYSVHFNNVSSFYTEESNDIHSSPDEGVEVGSQPLSEAVTSPEVTMSQQTDEGLGSMTSTPLEPQSQPESEQMEVVESCSDGGEDIPMEVVVDNTEVISKSLRRSMRQTQINQDQEISELSPKEISKTEKILLVRRAIQKKNTLNLPAKMKNGDLDEEELICSFCARTFFYVDNKAFRNLVFPLDCLAFKNNLKMINKLRAWYEKRKSKASDKKKMYENCEEDEDVDIETLAAECNDNEMAPTVEEADIVIQNDPEALRLSECGAPTGEISQTEIPLTPLNEEIPECLVEACKEDDLLRKDIKRFEKNLEIEANVRAWENKISPFLEELDHREAFDINLYGSRILNSFDISDGKQRKQTKSFRAFCKGMEQWQIHRYFMALLPLANIGNVLLETEEDENGDEQILITLLSKKMHHLRLEEFSSNQDSRH